MRNKRLLAIATFCVMGIFSQTVSAGLDVYLDGDIGVGPGGARPNSDNITAVFDNEIAGLNTINLIDFEDLSTGPLSSLLVAPGVTVSLSKADNNYAANGISTVNDVITGYNTTNGGRKNLGLCPKYEGGTASITFDFDVPIQAFGAYLTGVDTASGDLHVVFNDGVARDLSISGYSSGGVQFFGFISKGAAITSLVMELQGVSGNTRDVFGVDDVRFANVPEPATMMLLGLGGLMLRKRSKK